MGAARLILAAAVVVGHTWGDKPIGPFHLPGPYYAVQAFFVISGFYMALVISEKYHGMHWWHGRFYLNRALRLLPAYWVVLTVSYVLTVGFGVGDWPMHRFARGEADLAGQVGGGLGLAYFHLANLTMIGMDFGDFLAPQDPKIGALFLVGQAWSVGTEIWFYVLAPFLVFFRTRWLVAVAAASVACRLGTLALDLPTWPWQQRFFPSELLLFVAGVLAYRWYRTLRAGGHLDGRRARVAWAVLVVFLLTVGWLPGLQDPSLPVTLGVALVVGALLPWTFHATRRLRWERAAGELSYPIYLWHLPVYAFWPWTLAYPMGVAVLAIAGLLSIATILLVELPIERLRGVLGGAGSRVSPPASRTAAPGVNRVPA